MTDKIQALAQSIAEEFGAITVGGHGDTRGEYTVVDASPEEMAQFLANECAVYTKKQLYFAMSKAFANGEQAALTGECELSFQEIEAMTIEVKP